MRCEIDITNNNFDMVDFSESFLDFDFTTYAGGDMSFMAWGLCIKDSSTSLEVWSEKNAFMVVGKSFVHFSDVCEVYSSSTQLEMKNGIVVVRNNQINHPMINEYHWSKGFIIGHKYYISAVSISPYAALDVYIVSHGSVRVEYEDSNLIPASEYKPEIHSWFARL